MLSLELLEIRVKEYWGSGQAPPHLQYKDDHKKGVGSLGDVGARRELSEIPSPVVSREEAVNLA